MYWSYEKTILTLTCIENSMSSTSSENLLDDFIAKLESENYPKTICEKLKNILINKGLLTEQDITALIEECEPVID
jgi:hypothetical protein